MQHPAEVEVSAPVHHTDPSGATAAHATVNSPSRQRAFVPMIGQERFMDAATAVQRCDGPYTPSGACTRR